ncbi:serine O-acetyltransferase [Ovoidimarina sediminis]|uniref:serine O-acetyltransferase n=1 Tax=Ovoidimarina sediminis TaxID=3079856 RepID=UPI0029090EF9|nr:serine O-acetyltransferase [Rhodophyticola sp. MJ-SS7]MDU8943558.1 serine O-acetyltransferase [Rhodophyticola sp. MJ-SS7]
MKGILKTERAPEDIWHLLRREARVLADRTPFLAPILNDTLLSSASLPEALAQRIASALASPDVSKHSLHMLLLNVLNADPSIDTAAARDLAAVRLKDPACGTHIHAFLNYKAFHALVAHRIAHTLWKTGQQELAAWLSNRASAALGPDIHPGAHLGSGILLDHGSGIVIGKTAVVGDDVTILHNVTLGGTGKVRGDRHPKVRKGVMIGAGACVLGNIEIGAFSKIAAGSVVLKDVPPGCTVAGVPAHIVRSRQVAGLSEGDTKPLAC